jgi:hypothetical protein
MEVVAVRRVFIAEKIDYRQTITAMQKKPQTDRWDRQKNRTLSRSRDECDVFLGTVFHTATKPDA